MAPGAGVGTGIRVGIAPRKSLATCKWRKSQGARKNTHGTAGRARRLASMPGSTGPFMDGPSGPRQRQASGRQRHADGCGSPAVISGADLTDFRQPVGSQREGHDIGRQRRRRIEVRRAAPRRFSDGMG